MIVPYFIFEMLHNHKNIFVLTFPCRSLYGKNPMLFNFENVGICRIKKNTILIWHKKSYCIIYYTVAFFYFFKLLNKNILFKIYLITFLHITASISYKLLCTYYVSILHNCVSWVWLHILSEMIFEENAFWDPMKSVAF